MHITIYKCTESFCAKANKHGKGLQMFSHFRVIANISYLHKRTISYASPVRAQNVLNSLTHHVKVCPAMISCTNGSTLSIAVNRIIKYPLYSSLTNEASLQQTKKIFEVPKTVGRQKKEPVLKIGFNI